MNWQQYANGIFIKGLLSFWIYSRCNRKSKQDSTSEWQQLQTTLESKQQIRATTTIILIGTQATNSSNNKSNLVSIAPTNNNNLTTTSAKKIRQHQQKLPRCSSMIGSWLIDEVVFNIPRRCALSLSLSNLLSSTYHNTTRCNLLSFT